MTLKFTTTDKAAASHGVKCLIHGGSGFGKTRLCATAPNAIIISAESGLLSLKGVSIPVIEIKTYADLEEAYRWLTQAREASQFWTVCLDSLSEIAEVLLSHLIKTVGQKDPRKAYGELVPQMSSIIRSFRDIQGKNVYMSAKSEMMKDDTSGMMLYGPSAPGQKLGPLLPYFFDEVFALRMGKDQQGQVYRFLQTGPDVQYVAKDRSGELAMYEQPDLAAIIKKIAKQ